MKSLIPFCLTLIIFIGSAGVSKSADYQKGWEAYRSGDYIEALREWKPLAEQGNADAAHLIGRIYRNGKVFRRIKKLQLSGIDFPPNRVMPSAL